MVDALYTIFFLGFPAVVLLLHDRVKLIELLSPIAVCYLGGIVLGNIAPVAVSQELAMGFASGTILLAIPLLLFGVDILAWTRMAGKTMLSTALQFLSVVGVSCLIAYLFRAELPQAANLGGMMTGLMTGGTINMAAISQALAVPAETFVLASLGDVAIGGLYYMFVLSLGYRFYASFLPSAVPAEEIPETDIDGDDTPCWDEADRAMKLQVGDIVKPVGLAALVAGIAGALTLVVPKSVEEITAILAVTTLALAASFVPRIRALRGSYASGNYILMVFGVATGSMAHLDKLMQPGALLYVMFVGMVLATGIFVHVLLCRIFKIDAETMLITSVAGLYGPAFVGPVAARMGKPELVVSGIAAGLLGIASGTYIGIATARLLTGLFG